MTTRGRNLKSTDSHDNESDEEDDDDEGGPMDFERVFGTSSDIPKLEFMNVYQNTKLMDGLNTFEGESYFDLSTKIDLNTFKQPVLVSSTINLNPLAAVSFLYLQQKR